MKIDSREILPSGRIGITFRTNYPELEILQSAVNNALQFTPRTLETVQLIGRLQNMQKAFNKELNLIKKANV